VYIYTHTRMFICTHFIHKIYKQYLLVFFLNNNKIKHTAKRHCVYNLYIKYAQTTYLVYIHERVNETS
jgi:hypothetical protein